MRPHCPQALLLLGCLVQRPVALYNEEMTEALIGEQNRKAAAEAQAQGNDHWVEAGVGIAADGQPYVQHIARGKAYEHLRPGLLLVATAQDSAPPGSIFHQSVILVIEHSANGTLGLVINKLAELPKDEHMEPSEAIEELLGVAPRGVDAEERVKLVAGGPVPTSWGPIVLHSGAPPAGSRRKCYETRSSGVPLRGLDGQLLVEGSINPASGSVEEERPPAGVRVAEGIYAMPSAAFVRCALRDGAEDAPMLRVATSHAGWGGGQLDGEFRRGGWLLCEMAADLVFAEGALEAVWRSLLFSRRGRQLCSSVGAEMG